MAKSSKNTFGKKLEAPFLRVKDFFLAKHRKIRNPLMYYLSNLLIVVPLIVLLNIYLPIIWLYLPIPKTQPPLTDTSFYIDIPKIEAKVSIIPEVDAFNKDEYTQALQKGVAQAKGTKLPGEKGLIYLFAHSYDSPFRMTSYNTAFFRLGQLNEGDNIYIYRNGKKYTYRVSAKKVIWPNEVKYLTGNNNDELILQTCTPIGTSLKRLLVFANPIT